MVKSMVMAALFLAFLASANAITVRTTTVTTTIEDEMNPGQQCMDEVQTATQMRECMMYISEGSPYGVALRMVVNPGEQMLQQCCKKLSNVAEECRCKVIDEMMKMMEQQQGQGQQSEQHMMQTKMLPKMCKMEPQVC